MRELRDALGEARDVFRRRRPRDGARRGLPRCFRSTSCRSWGSRDPAQTADDLPPHSPGDASRAGSEAGRARHHRQSGFHPARRKARARARSVDSDRRLRFAHGLGMAARPGARHARDTSTACWRCCRSSRRCTRGSAGRLAPMSVIRCSNSSTSCARTRPSSSSASVSGSGRSARQPARRDAPSHGAVRRDPGATARHGRPASSRCCRRCRIWPTVIHDMSARWPVRPRIVVGDDERRAAFRTARAALAKSGTVTLELALVGRADGDRLSRHGVGSLHRPRGWSRCRP